MLFQTPIRYHQSFIQSIFTLRCLLNGKQGSPTSISRQGLATFQVESFTYKTLYGRIGVSRSSTVTLATLPEGTFSSPFRRSATTTVRK